MKTFTLGAFLSLFATIAHCQVHVRGYYRSNGTYVAPHERTRPNNTITDNYSYPGNYNPNKAQVNNYTISTGDYTPPVYYSESEGSKISTRGRKELFVISKTARLRASPNINGEVICNLDDRQRLLFIEDTGFGWSKVLYKYYTGYNLQLPRYVIGFVNSKLISNKPSQNNNYIYFGREKIKLDTYTANSINAYANENFDEVSDYLRRTYNSNKNSNNLSTMDGCLYTTSFDNPVFSPPLRSLPNVNSSSVYSCPTNSIICVIEKSNSAFYKVKVDGQVGYVSKGFLTFQ